MQGLVRLSIARIVLLLAAAAVGYFLFATVGDSILSHDLDQDEQALRHDIDDLTRQQAELEAIRDYLRTDEYIEGVARRVLGLVRQGEALVIVSSSATPEPTPVGTDPPDDATGRTWWEQLYGQ